VIEGYEMLDQSLKLIDRLIDMAKRREEQDWALYTNYLGLAFADFEAVHKDYLANTH
jgi:hypothetical protein